LVSSPDVFESLRSEWRTLAAAQSSPFCRWEWFYSAVLAFHNGKHLKTIVLRRDGQIAAVAPLLECSTRNGPNLTVIGSAALHEPCDLLYIDRPALHSLVNCMCELGRPIYLDRLSLESETRAGILPLLQKKGFTIRKSAGPSRFLPVMGRSWDDFLDGLPSKNRYDIRRLYRRADNFGKVRCDIVSPTPSKLNEILEKVFDIEALGWKGKAGSAIRSNPNMEAFFRSYCAFAAEEGYLRIALLTLQDRTVAVMIAAELGSRFWVFKIGYDPEWSRFSPGILLMNETIKYSFQKNLQGYEFLGSDEPWIHLWTGKKNSHPFYLVAFYPHNARGAACLATDAGRYFGHKIYRSLRSCLAKG
jgi:CelD/BcsL family acetyltransferase involved in cellulose biosynthesis